MKNKQSQVSMEFILLMTFMLLFFVIFLAMVQHKMQEITYEKESELLQEVGNYIKNEISLAYTAYDGYYREFELPPYIAEKSYSIRIKSNKIDDSNNRLDLELRFENRPNIAVVRLPPLEILSEKIRQDTFIIQPGKNIIQKRNGIVTLQPSSF